MKKLIYQPMNGYYNPLKDIKENDLQGWEIGNMKILFKERSNKLRNLVCDELGIKAMVFGQKKR
jgi:hypothetical protein